MCRAIGAMVETLRREGRFGCLFANGGFATDNHGIVLGNAPIPAARFPQDFDYQAEAKDKRGPVPELVEQYAGSATTESYTAFHRRDGNPKAAVVVARTPEGRTQLYHVHGRGAATLASLPAAPTIPSDPSRVGVLLGSRTGWEEGRER